MPSATIPLSEVKRRIDPEAWDQRVAAADAEAEQLARVLDRVRAGESRRAALAAEVPERLPRTMLARLRKYEVGGRDALIDRRAPKAPERKVTAEVRGAVRALANANPELGSEALIEALDATVGIRLGGSTMRELLAALGLSRARGRPPRSSAGAKEDDDSDPPVVTPLPFAGAELLEAVEVEVGAVRRLTQALGDHLAALPEPEGEVLDDRANRDERGRFLPAYNEAKERTEPEQGEKFDSVDQRRGEKDLREMRVANSSFQARYRKDLLLTYLPIVVNTARWSSLAHWRAGGMGELSGYAYMPSTLDKHVRQLKLCGAAEAAREAVTAFWLEKEDLSGAAVVYIDAATKPVWTHQFTRCLKVSGNGRVMPGMSTMWLNSGSGTPLVYRTFSGQTSVPGQVSALLQQVESALGVGTTERMVVLDRESHAVWLFKELAANSWKYIVPLKTSVTGPKARFEELGEWRPYGTAGDETREGWLWLNDSRAGEEPLRHRVVARKRHRTGKVSWFATNAAADVLDASAVIDRYFARWPLQEHVFRDGNGRVGLNVHHGYGKKKVTNVAVLTALDELESKLSRCVQQLEQSQRLRDGLAAEHRDWLLAEETLRETRNEVSDAMAQHIANGSTDSAALATCYAELSRTQRWLDEARDELLRTGAALDKVKDKVRRMETRLDRLTMEKEAKAARTTIFTVDTELDEIMTAYKLTFMNLVKRLMEHHLKEPMEIDTLIEAVLTLPGERVVTRTTETVRIFRQSRDARVMEAVERACSSINALEQQRGPAERRRRFRIELVDGSVADGMSGSV